MRIASCGFHGEQGRCTARCAGGVIDSTLGRLTDRPPGWLAKACSHSLRIREAAVAAVARRNHCLGGGRSATKNSPSLLSIGICFAASALLLGPAATRAEEVTQAVTITGTLEQRVVIEVSRDPKISVASEVANSLVNVAEPRARDPGRDGGGVGSPASDQNTDQGDKKDKKVEKPTCPSDQNPSTPTPVIVATGQKFLPQLDFVAGGSYGLGLTRTYRSYATTSTLFGPNWASSLEFPTVQTSGCYRSPGPDPE